MACARFIVRGWVQGVFFRAATRERALKLGIAGYAKNLPGGDVEVLVCGTDQALADLERWLHVGPPDARVQKVLREELPDQSLRGFITS